MREVVTPTPRRRNRGAFSPLLCPYSADEEITGATPGRTPFGTEPSDTPTYFSETPSRATPRTKAARAQPETRYDDTLSLDAFQAKYTSEDNSSFAGLLNSDNKVRREKYNWAWDAERKANVKAIRGREARERLVDMTRKMVESDKDGMVRMVEGAPGRPGERRLVVEGGMEAPSRLMVEGKTGGDGRLMITEGGEAVKGMGKGKEVAEGSGFVDWDKPTVEEEEDAKALKDVDCQVPMDGWKFTVSRLSLPDHAETDLACRIATRSCSLPTPTSLSIAIPSSPTPLPTLYLSATPRRFGTMRRGCRRSRRETRERRVPVEVGSTLRSPERLVRPLSAPLLESSLFLPPYPLLTSS